MAVVATVGDTASPGADEGVTGQGELLPPPVERPRVWQVEGFPVIGQTGSLLIQ